MSKHDLRARPIYHYNRESIDAHLTVVFAALTVTRLAEEQTRLADQEVRAHRPPLPHRRDPRRTTRSDRRRPAPGRTMRRTRRDYLTPRCTLT
jgi:hypothetical protein